MQTIFGARLQRHAAESRAVPAMVVEGREITYPELFRHAANCAAWMTREGCVPSEVVGITIADEYRHMVASLALLMLGIPQASLPTRDPGSMRCDLAQRLGAGRVVVSDPQHGLDGLPMLLMPESILAAAGGSLPVAASTDADAPAIHFVSSGTTGEPKIFSLSQRMLAWRAERMAESERIASGYRALMLVSVEDAPGKSKRLTTTYLGVTSLFRTGAPPTPMSVPALCNAVDATCLELSVLQVMSIVHDQTDAGHFSARLTVYVSGSRVPAQLRRAFAKRFAIPLFVHYGAREIGRIATTYPDGDDDAMESVGRPVPWIDLEIVDGEGKLLPAGELGEIRVRSEHMVREYHRDSVACARHFREGWFYPGDLGSFTRDGTLCVYGRSDDMMNLNSIKIFPAEIERVLEEHSAVKSAAAFAKSSPVHGEIPVAAVELHESATVAVEELMARARERLGARAPRKIVVVGALPRNIAGKVLKHALIGLIGPDK